jgi:beta-glucosidase
MGDRNDLLLWHNGTELVQQVAQNCSNTIVGLQIPSAIDMEAFADHPNVTAIVNFGMAGQEAGNAVVDILFGAVNPSGRLPYTIGKRREDYAADVEYFNTTDLTPSSPISTIPQLDYVEKLNIDYVSSLV